MQGTSYIKRLTWITWTVVTQLWTIVTSGPFEGASCCAKAFWYNITNCCPVSTIGCNVIKYIQQINIIGNIILNENQIKKLINPIFKDNYGGASYSIKELLGIESKVKLVNQIEGGGGTYNIYWRYTVNNCLLPSILTFDQDCRSQAKR